MIKKRLLQYFVVLIIYKGIITKAQNKSKTCGIGCLQCNNYQICSQCQQGFQLNVETNKCINNQCQEGLFQYDDISTNDQSNCKQICSNNYYQSVEQRLCIKLEECSLSFRSTQNINISDSLIDIISYAEDFILIIYQKSISQFRRSNGKIEYQTLINEDITSLTIFQNELIIIKDHAIFKWNLLKNKQTFLVSFYLEADQQKQAGTLLLNINNQAVVIVYVREEQQKIIIQQQFTLPSFDIKQTDKFEIEYSSLNILKFYKSAVFQIGSQGIRIDLIKYDIIKNNIQIIKFTQNKYYCENFTFTNLKSVGAAIISNSYFLIFDKSFDIYKLTMENCTKFDLQQQPLNFSSFQLENLEYLVVSFLTSLSIFDINLTQIKQFEFKSINILDFILVGNQEIQASIFILQNNSIIQYLSISKINEQLSFSLIDQFIKVYIDNPNQLFYIPQTSPINYNSRLIIAGSEVQSNIILDQNNLNIDEKQEYLIVNYEFFYDFVSNKIISGLEIDNLNIFIACSQEGIFAWDVAHIYSSQILYFFKTLNDPCIEINYIKNSDISITFASKIIIIDVNYFTLKQTFKLNTSTSLFVPKISFQQTYGILIFDLNIFYYDIENYTLTKLQFADYNNNIQLISLQEDDVLIIQFLQSIKLYLIDYQNKKVNSFSEKSFLNKIIKARVRNFPQKKFEIVTYLENKTFLIIDQSLSSITIQFLQTDPNDDSYFILGRSTKVSTSFPVEIYFLTKKNLKPQLSLQASSGVYLLEPVKKSDSRSQIYYQQYLVYWQSTYSLIATYIFYPVTQSNFVSDILYMFLSINSKIYQANNNKNYILTDSKGYVGVNSFNSDYYKTFYKLSQSDKEENNIIIKTISSFILNKVFIIKTKTILIFNIHTSIFEEEITFITNKTDQIQKYFILEQDSVLIVCKKGIILLRDFVKNKQQILEDEYILNFNVYFKNDESFLVVFGTQIQLLKLDLTPQIQFNYKIEENSIKVCRVSNRLIICQLIQNNQIIILFEETLILKSTIQPKSLNKNISLYLDEEYSRIYLCSKSIEIYSYDGTFINIIDNFSENITDFYIFNENIILIQSSFQSYVRLYDRLNSKLKTIFTIPTTGYILTSLIVEEYNHLLISIDNIQFAQILVYSLVDLILYSFVKNTLVFNDISKVISIIFDKDFNQLIFLDFSCNLTIISYKNLQQTHNINRIYDFYYQVTKQPQGFSISFENNNGFIFNEEIIYKINYSRQTQFFNKYEMISDNCFTKLPQQTSNVQKKNYYYILQGQQNTIYIYYDFNFIYFGKIKKSEQIQSIKYLQNYNILVFAFQKFFQVIDLNKTPLALNLSVDSIEFKIETRYSLKVFLCQNIIQSYDNQIIHYNFTTMSPINIIDIQQRVSKTLCSETELILVVGFIDGNSILYDIKTLQITKFSQSLNSQKNHIKYLQETENIIWVSSMSGSTIGINKSNKQVQYNFNFTEKLNINNKEVLVFKVDSDYHRIFINYFGEKKVYCLNFLLSDINQNIIYLSFPSSEYNQIKITQTQVIFYSTTQLNIHDRNSLKYLISIRRNIYYDHIVTLKVFQEQYYFILSLYKFEIFRIDFKLKQVYLLDQVAVNYLQLVDAIFDEQSLTLKIIGIIKNQVFQETYSLGFFGKKILSGQTGCSYQLNQLSFQSMTNQMLLIKPVYQQLPSLLGQVEMSNINQIRLINIYLKSNDFSEINFEATQNSQLIIQAFKQPNNESRGIISINESLFNNFNKKELKLKDSEFIFSDNIDIIQFNKTTKNIYLQNIIIQNQELTNMSIKFYDLNEVVIEDITLKNLNITINNKDYQYSFLDFFNCEKFIIKNIKLTNFKFLSNANTFFISLNQLTKVKITNLEIDDCFFDILFLFSNIQNLELNNVKISNCRRIGQLYIDIPYFIKIQAIQNTLIQNAKIVNNQNILFLNSDNKNEDNFEDSQLINDVIIIQDSIFQKNLKTFNTTPPQFKINATTINLTNINYTDNNFNILLINTNDVTISNSNFLNNEGINGGAISFINNKNTILIEKSNFENNQAFGSGGALYFKQQSGNIKIDESTQINNNRALIGGGIRIQNSYYDNDERFISQIPSKNLKDNKVLIYGEQFAMNLESIQITSVTSTSLTDNVFINYQFLNENQLNLNDSQTYSGKLIVQGVKSGDTLIISMKPFDIFGDFISFSPEQYIQNNYTQDIQYELSQYQIRIESQNQKIAVLNGQTIIKSESFSKEQSAFIFKELQVMGYPNTKGYLTINYQLNNKKTKPILVDILFKSCITGEILKLYDQNIYSCQQCPFGTYSIYDYPQDQIDQQSEIQNQLSCQKCPDSAESCEGSVIKLKQGYWRINQQTDVILECKNNPSNCDEQDNNQKNGCVEGYIGPLCEECDSLGQIWKGTQYSIIFTSKYICGECNFIGYQVLMFILFSIFIIIYSLISTIFFMNSFIYTQTCYYLRQLNILPISKSSIKDRSSFCLKILINYIQITSILVKFELNLFQQYFSEILNALQSPSSQTVNSLDCLLNKVVQSRIQRARLHLFIYALNPIIYTIIVAAFLRILQKFKLFQVKTFHIYTLMNFMFIYFQPNSITYFIQSIVCRRIGDQFYTGLDLTIECDDEEYTYFVHPFSGTILFFYLFFPLYCFYKLRQCKNKLQNCITKYKYGFFYSEYKSTYYYWEFIRINLRVLIFTVFILLNQNKSLAYLIIIFLIYLYIKSILIFNPIQVTKLMKYEILSFYAIIINIICHNIIQYYSNIYLETIFYLFHLSVFLFLMLVILHQKLFSRFNFIGKTLLFLLKQIASQNFYNQFLKKNTTAWSTFKRWRLIRKKVLFLIFSNSFKTYKDMNVLEQKKNRDISLIKVNSQKETSTSQIIYNSSQSQTKSALFRKKSQLFRKYQQHRSYLLNQSLNDQKIQLGDTTKSINAVKFDKQKSGDNTFYNFSSLFIQHQESQQFHLTLTNSEQQKNQFKQDFIFESFQTIADENINQSEQQKRQLTEIQLFQSISNKIH